MKYNKRWEWNHYAEYRSIFRCNHRYRIGSAHVPIRFRKTLAIRGLNTKRRIVDNWKRCYQEVYDEHDWHRSDV